MRKNSEKREYKQPCETLHKYLSQDESLFYAHVTLGQSGT